VSITREVAPIKLGWLSDMVIPKTPELDVANDMTLPLELVFRDAVESGLLDRPVEIVVRMVEGLPRGTVKAVIDAYGELVDEGCLAVFGPHISENTSRSRPSASAAPTTGSGSGRSGSRTAR
jgi:branched-chain amino acid transport system substrate-binding protein